MLKALDVFLWGTRVGTAYCRDGHPIVQFEYSDEIRALGVEVSPLVMPLGPTRFEFPDLPIQSFKGLPGLLSDSLPDKFGNKVIAAWLREQGKGPEDLIACAVHGNISSRRAHAFISEVRDAVREWPRFAAEAEVKDEFVAKIGARLAEEAK